MKTWEVQMDIFALRRQGFSFRAIAHKLGIHRETVKKYLQENRPPAEHRRTNHKESVLAPFSRRLKTSCTRTITGLLGYITRY